MKPIFNALEFDGINSMDHGIFITGESVYDAPERDVESVEIAGRNGNVLIDNGRWKNLEVTYHAGTFGKNQAEFANKIRNFRNLLASRFGYHRLMDTYNPEEYRIGRFKSVEVEAEGRKRAGEFDIVFDCKPQRYLTSGESGVTVSNGESLYNPTPYDASPLLAIKGYGAISFNGYEIELENATLGEVELRGSWGMWGTNTYQVSNSSYNDGDTIKIKNAVINLTLETNFDVTVKESSDSNSDFLTRITQWSARKFVCNTTVYPIEFTAGTSGTITNTTSIALRMAAESTTVMNATLRTTITYTAGGDSKDTFRVAVSLTYDRDRGDATSYGSHWEGIEVDSTLSLLGDPTYIDCDLGDAYMIRDGEYVSLNSYIDLGSDLPVLASGNNEITIDNTITELKITPRFWIL